MFNNKIYFKSLALLLGQTSYLVTITHSDWSAHVTPTNEKTGSAETEEQLALKSDSD